MPCHPQAANIQIMISLLIAMALQSNRPHPEDPESILFDALLMLSHGIVIAIGSYSFFNCIRSRYNAAAAHAKTDKAAKAHRSCAAVHPLGSLELQRTKEGAAS